MLRRYPIILLAAILCASLIFLARPASGVGTASGPAVEGGAEPRSTTEGAEELPQEAAPEDGLTELTTSAALTLAVVLGIIILFAWEPVPIFMIALGIPVVLAALQPWTKLSPSEAIAGFASTATITIMAMYILTAGIRRTGIIQIIGDKITNLAGSSISRQVGIITCLSGPTAGFINNTPVVAILIPTVMNLANRLKTSPSKLMIPLSYASMMGGTLTLVGSSTNLLASEISDRLLDHPFSFFEFTGVGCVILLVGIVYLVTVGHVLLPDRVQPDEDLAEGYEIGEFPTELVLPEDSEYVGMDVEDLFAETGGDVELIQIVRQGEKLVKPFKVKALRQDDHLIVRSNPKDLLRLLNIGGLKLFSHRPVPEQQLEEPAKGQVVIHLVIPSGSFLEAGTLNDVSFCDRYDATVLAVRRGEELLHGEFEDIRLQIGDVLLLLATQNTLRRLRANDNFVVAEKIDPSDFESSKTLLAVGIFAGVILLAAFGVTSIVISALGGALLMGATGCVRPKEMHERVNWEVIFLLAGLIPLGVAMEKSGAAQYLGTRALQVAGRLPPLGAVAFFYLITAVLANLIHKNAGVVLMIPVAVNAAEGMGLNPFPFVITVLLAGSTAFLTPVGNHTNLMVYGPGGYKFTDFFKVGAPLQLLLTVVTPFAVSWFWPLAGP